MDNFNPEKIRNNVTQQVLLHNYEQGPLLLLAGPGTGKTYSLLMKIKELLINNYSIDDILEVTLTNAAVNDFTAEAKKEIINTYNSSTTLHYKAKGILHRYANIIDLNPNFSIISGYIENIFIQDLSVIYGSSKKIIARNIKIYQKTSSDCEEIFDRFSSIYRKLQLFYSSIDWYDVVYFAIKILENNPAINDIESGRFNFLLVDEYQDLNNADQRLIELLLNKRNTLLAVGDDDQSIYSGRFANPSGIRNFTSRYPKAKIINLPVTSRLPSNIINSSQCLISKNVNRITKNKLIPLIATDKRADKGFVISINNKSDKAEKEFIGKALTLLVNNGISPSNILVLCNCKSLGLELYEFILNEFNYLHIDNNLSSEYDINQEQFIISSIRKFILDPTDNLSLRVIIDVLENDHKKEISTFIKLTIHKNLSIWEAINDEELRSEAGIIEPLLMQIVNCYFSLSEIPDIQDKINYFLQEFIQLDFLLQYIISNEYCDDPFTTSEVEKKIKFMTMHSSKVSVTLFL